MWKKLYEVLSRLLALTQKVERHDKEILGLQQEVKNLTAVVQRLVYEIQRISDRETHERDKMQLQLENQLVRFERRLPPAVKDEDNNETN
jgi:Skp family chaperone for outer membrane proteins